MRKALANPSSIGFVIFVTTVISIVFISTVVYFNYQTSETIIQNTDRIIDYQRCTSKLRATNGDQPSTPEQVDDCVKTK